MFLSICVVVPLDHLDITKRAVAAPVITCAVRLPRDLNIFWEYQKCSYCLLCREQLLCSLIGRTDDRDMVSGKAGALVAVQLQDVPHGVLQI